MDKVRNPKTKRSITIGASTFKNLLKEGYEYDESNNTLTLPSDATVSPTNISTVHPIVVRTIAAPPILTKQRFTPIEPSDTDIKVLIHDVTVNHIIHLSDIHIPLNLHNKRHEEYKQVFDNLYSYISSNIELSTSVIVITGDLLHTKLKLEAETIQLARDFLDECSKLAPTIVIIGNHDFTENNTERADTLSAVADRLPIHVLKHTGIYQVGTMLFVFNSLFDNKFIKHHDIPSTDMPVYALFHGTVVGSTTDAGIVLKESMTKSYPTINDFIGYDAVLLGHVHKQQFLRTNIAYAGSLIQQNYGEKIQGHGLLLWNTKTHSAKNIDIVNTYVHLNITIIDGQLTLDARKLLDKYSQSKLYIKYSCTNTTLEQINDIVIQLKAENYAIVDSKIYKPSEASITIDQLPIHNNTYLTLDEEIKLIMANAKPHLAEQVTTLHKRYYTNHQSTSGFWYPTRMTWKNIGIYGNDHENHIDFINGITNICSPNMTGKTTIWIITAMVLYHRTSTHLKSATDILNKYASKGYIELDFIHNGRHYKIQKHIKRMLRSARNAEKEIYETDFFCIDETGNLRNLNGASQTQTLSIIKQYVGSLEAFLDGNLISTRSDINSILGKTPAELLKHFHRICNTEHYEDYIKQCNLDSKDISKQLTKIRNNNDYIATKLESNTMASIKDSLTTKSETLKTYQDQHKTLSDQRDSVHMELAKIKKPTILSTLSIPNINQQIAEYNTEKNKFSDSVIETASRYTLEDEVKRDIDDLSDNLHNGLPSIDDIDNDIIALELEIQDVLPNKPPDSDTVLFTLRGKIGSELRSLEDKISEVTVKLKKIPSTQLKLPSDFNIDETTKRLADTLARSNHLKTLIPSDQHIDDIPKIQQLLSKLPISPDTEDITELEVLRKHKKQELSKFSLPCSSTNSTEQQLSLELKDLVPVPLKLQQPLDLVHQIADLKTKHRDLLNNSIVKQRDTWYQPYIDNITLNNIPLTTFKEYYDDANRMEFNRVDTQLQKLSNIQNHNKDVESKIKQNAQIQNHNDSIHHKLNWLKKQQLVDDISQLETSLQYKRLHIIIENLHKLKQLQADHDHYTSLSNTYYRSQYQKKLQSHNSELTEKRSDLKAINNHIQWWTQLKTLTDEQHSLKQTRTDIQENINTEREICHLRLVKKYIHVTNCIAQLIQDKIALQDSDRYTELLQQRISIDDKINDINSKIKSCNQDINKYTQQLQSINDIEQNKEQLTQLELEYSIYEEYKKLFDRKAIPATILKSKLQLFVDQTNQIFSACTKYRLQHAITDKDKLEFTIIDNITNASLEPHRLSGYETVALQIAQNKATIDIATTHRTSLFIIDESLDCIDQERFTKVINMLCSIIRQHFTVTLIISHRVIPTDAVDHNIHITHRDNCSYIE